MGDWTLLAANVDTTWCVVPLAAAISLVYNASRYELPERIVKRAAWMFVKILAVMAIVFLILLALSFRL